MDVRHARIEEAIEALDQADDLDLQLIGAHDRAVDGRVERGRIAARRQNADAFHSLFRSDNEALGQQRLG